MSELDYLEFFKEEILNRSATVRLGAASRLNLIASALGPQKTVDQLLPYITQAIQEEPLCSDEELLFNIAKQCAELSDHFYIGGRDELLVAPLEYLASQEETVIREQAIISMCRIVAKRHSLVPDLVGTVHRLASTSDFFTPRVSACGLLPSVYRHAAKEQRTSLREVFTNLCEDDAPMVRRAAANRLGDLVSVCETQAELPDMIAVFKRLSREDTQDTIRISCVHSALEFAQKLSEEDRLEHALPFIKDAVRDRSWRVRLAVARKFDQLCATFGPEVTSTDLVPSLIQLMQDTEQEVRKEAVRAVEACLRLEYPISTEQLQTEVLPQLQQLGLDLAGPVRSVLAQVVGPVAMAIGQYSTQQQLFALVHDLTKDESPEVRFSISSHMALLCEVLGADGPVHTLLISIQHLIVDNYWRIRKKIIEQMPRLARLFGVEVFQLKLETACLSSLRDSVSSVREAVIEHMKEVAEALGPTWTIDNFLPKVLEDQCSKTSTYVCRVTMLHVLPRVSEGMSPDQVMKHIIPVLIKATKDPVPNVRFCACRDISWVIERDKLGDVAINSVIKPALLELEHDSDIDVQFFASRALAACSR